MFNIFRKIKEQNNVYSLINNLKEQYYRETIKKLENGDEITMNLSGDEIVGGFVNSMSYDKEKNVRISLTLDVETAKKIIFLMINEKLKKDTKILSFNFNTTEETKSLLTKEFS